MDSPITRFLDHPQWQAVHRSRQIPLGESAEIVSYPAGERLFRQFHPANQFALLIDGVVEHETGGEKGRNRPLGRVSWQWGALGWSGFMPPSRHGTSARALTDVEVIRWNHDDLATIFYSDPVVAVTFFRFVLDSVRKQFERVRKERVVARPAQFFPEPPPPASLKRTPDPVEIDALTAMRRSAFFGQFDDDELSRLAEQADPLLGDPAAPLVDQGEATGGMLILADGEATAYFSAISDLGVIHDRFRTIPEFGGVLAGIPTLDDGFLAEATILAESPCRIYRVGTSAIERLLADEPEFGRRFMQLQLTRLSYLIATARLPDPQADDDPEIGAIKSVLEHNQARIPTTSSLHRLPPLLGHRLTLHEAFGALRTARESGNYQERAIANWSTDVLQGVRREMRFYDEALTTYETVASAPDDAPPEQLRNLCDQRLTFAFSHLETEVRGLSNLPANSGNIVIMNHLGCPAYYELPNHYHFSFDTAFVSALLYEHYGASPIRVVRQSPGVEHGHDLFYGRLGHIVVPTKESGLETTSPNDFDELRRRASRTLLEQGRTVLARGDNILVCPEGQSQRAEHSPARFHSGAFRLAFMCEPEPYIVPIAIAGFERRYKSSKLVAVVQEPFLISDVVGNVDEIRPFLDGYREHFRLAALAAQALSRGLSPGEDPHHASDSATDRGSRGAPGAAIDLTA